jgi:hypothetical protein
MSQATQRRKILFFTAGIIPTATEQEIAAQIDGAVYFRNGAAAGLGAYGSGKLEDADGFAGTVPAAYTTAIANYPAGNVDPGIELKPEALYIAPGTAGVSGTGTLQLRVVKTEVDPDNGVMSQADVTAACTYVSSDPTKATVNASTGLVTGVAAGTTTITASYDYDGAGSLPAKTATRLFTVT